MKLWLIERGTSGQFWVSGHCSSAYGPLDVIMEQWTTHPDKAQKFSKEGAAAHIKELKSWPVPVVGDLRAVEHVIHKSPSGISS